MEKGPEKISQLQRESGANVYFNTLVRFGGRLIKYGCIDLDHFLKDMQTWETLYVSGRLHKPVVSLKGLKDPAIANAFNFNLRAAVETSLLTLPEVFQEEDLYMRIAGLSYSGDFRMTFGEDKGKVRNIVRPNLDRFRDLYSNIVSKSKALHLHEGVIEQNISTPVQGVYIKRLPSALQQNLFKEMKIDEGRMAPGVIDQTVQEMASERDKLRKATINSVADITAKSSMSQSIKGLTTAGFYKSRIYSGMKLKKMFRSLVRR